MKRFLAMPTFDSRNPSTDLITNLDVDNIDEYIVNPVGSVGDYLLNQGLMPRPRGAPAPVGPTEDNRTLNLITYMFRGNRTVRQLYTTLTREEIESRINSHLSRPSNPINRVTNTR